MVNEDDLIRQQFQDVTYELPGNFGWLVTQRIMALRIERARQKALFETTIVSIGVALTAIAMLAGFSIYYGQEASTWFPAGGMAMPGVLALALFVIIDSGYRSLKTGDSR
jgi:hypothetical protein